MWTIPGPYRPLKRLNTDFLQSVHFMLTLTVNYGNDKLSASMSYFATGPNNLEEESSLDEDVHDVEAGGDAKSRYMASTGQTSVMAQQQGLYVES